MLKSHTPSDIGLLKPVVKLIVFAKLHKRGIALGGALSLINVNYTWFCIFEEKGTNLRKERKRNGRERKRKGKGREEERKTKWVSLRYR